jgi:hypothetical protein
MEYPATSLPLVMITDHLLVVDEMQMDRRVPLIGRNREVSLACGEGNAADARPTAHQGSSGVK